MADRDGRERKGVMVDGYHVGHCIGYSIVKD